MYISVNSKSDTADDNAKGKTMWVNDDPSKIKVARDAPEHLGQPPWHIEFTLEQYVEHSDGSRGGDYFVVKRTAEVQITPADINAILEVAVREGLISITAKGREENK